MSESPVTIQENVFPFPNTPRLTTLTGICQYLNDCGFDITWQSFLRTYQKYIKTRKATVRKLIRQNGLDDNDPRSHDKINLLIIRNVLKFEIRSILVACIQDRGLIRRNRFAASLKSYCTHGTLEERRNAMIKHLDAVLEVIYISLSEHDGGESNQRYLNNLYRSAMKITAPSIQITRKPEHWFIVLENQHDVNIDLIAPKIANTYVAIYEGFACECSQEKPNIDAIRAMREEMRNIMMEYGFTRESEKRIYRQCATIIDLIDEGKMDPKNFRSICYEIVRGEAVELARKGASDAMAHLAVIDHRVAEFLSDIFAISQKEFQKKRHVFAHKLAERMSQDSLPQSSPAGIA